MVLRGLKTLGIRIERAQQSAMEIAHWLEQQPEVSKVLYIGLESHPQHELAKRQMSGFGSMISFELKGGMKAGSLLMDHVRVATLAVSLGGVETLIEHPASMTHASISPADRRRGWLQRRAGALLGRHRRRRRPDRRSSSSTRRCRPSGRIIGSKKLQFLWKKPPQQLAHERSSPIVTAAQDRLNSAGR